jgi:hypothetical protein
MISKDPLPEDLQAIGERPMPELYPLQFDGSVNYLAKLRE